ncbi:MAG: hypothetical protein ACO1NX_05185 [Chitinophagaceae bacterium]
MYNETNNQQTPIFLHKDSLIQVAYSFSEYTENLQWNNSSKVWLDILFVHPENDEPANVRVAKSNLILHQPKEVVEAIVHREVRSFLQLPLSVYDYV